MEEDVKNGANALEGDSDTPPENESVEEKPAEKSIPYHRFKEVNDELKTVKNEIAELKNQKASGGLTPEQDKELQAKQYLEKLLDERIEAREKSSKEKEAREQREFENNVREELESNPDVERPKFLKFLEEEADKYGVKSVSGAMLLFRRLNEMTKTVSEKTKKEIAAKPNMPKTGGGGDKPNFLELDKGKSFSQIAEEIKRTV